MTEEQHTPSEEPQEGQKSNSTHSSSGSCSKPAEGEQPNLYNVSKRTYSQEIFTYNQPVSLIYIFMSEHAVEAVALCSTIWQPAAVIASLLYLINRDAWLNLIQTGLHKTTLNGVHQCVVY